MDAAHRDMLIVALHAEIPHAIEAIRDSAFLLTLSTETAHPAEQQDGGPTVGSASVTTSPTTSPAALRHQR